MVARSRFAPLALFLTVVALVLSGASVAVGESGSSDDRGDRSHQGRSDDFRARLRGSNEVPPVSTRARGTATFDVSRRANPSRIDYDVSWRRGTDMLAVAGAHLHCAPAGENGPVVAFLAGVVAGGLDGRVEFEATLTDDNIVNPACGSTITELVESMAAGDVYVNVHSAANPSGDIRGQVTPRRRR